MRTRPPWFEYPALDEPERARFGEVASTGNRIPSWIPGGRKKSSRKAGEPSLRPPKLPSELVSAIHHELHDSSMERSARHSRPPGEAGRASQLPNRLSTPPEGFGIPPATPIETARLVDPVATQAFMQAVALLDEERCRVLAETASQLAELATTIARRVIGRELSLNPRLVCDLVREGLDSLAQQDRVVVRIGQGFASARESILEQVSDRDRRCEVRLDPTLGDYGCVVETELGRVDESIETRLATLLQALRPESDGAEAT